MNKHFSAAKQLLPFYGDVKLINVLRGNDVGLGRKKETEKERERERERERDETSRRLRSVERLSTRLKPIGCFFLFAREEGAELVKTEQLPLGGGKVPPDIPSVSFDYNFGNAAV